MTDIDAKKIDELLRDLDGYGSCGDFLTETPLVSAMHEEACEIAAENLNEALRQRARAEEAERQRKRLKDRTDILLNDRLVEMREGYDDSIVGFNEAWDIVRSVFADMESDHAGK